MSAGDLTYRVCSSARATGVAQRASRAMNEALAREHGSADVTRGVCDRHCRPVRWPRTRCEPCQAARPHVPSRDNTSIVTPTDRRRPVAATTAARALSRNVLCSNGLQRSRSRQPSAASYIRSAHCLTFMDEAAIRVGCAADGFPVTPRLAEAALSTPPDSLRDSVWRSCLAWGSGPDRVPCFDRPLTA